MEEEKPIRIGNLDDLDPIMELLSIACDEMAFVKPDQIKILEQAYNALIQNHGLIGIIGDEGGKIEGFVLLRIGKMWYSDVYVLEEKLVFIHPDFRSAKGGRARRLVQFAKETSDFLKIPLVIGILSNDRTEAKLRLYERQFGKPAGGFFLYNARTGNWRDQAE